MKRVVSTTFPMAALAIMLLLAWSSGALAYDSDLAAFRSAYSGETGGRLDSCSLCHSNAFGNAYESAGHSFVPIEPLDSDGDGYTNLTEIMAHSFPGNVGDVPAGLLFYDNFSNAGAEVPNWRTVNAVGASRKLVTSSTLTSRGLVNVGVADVVDDGRILTKVKLTATAAGTPNGGILLWFQNTKNNVAVKLTPTTVSIVQKAAGVATVLAGQSSALGTTAHALKVDFYSDGLVEVYLDGFFTVAGTADAFAPGKVGIYAAKTKAIFDNFSVADGTVLGP